MGRTRLILIKNNNNLTFDGDIQADINQIVSNQMQLYLYSTRNIIYKKQK